MTWEVFLGLVAVGVGIIGFLSLYSSRNRGFDADLPPERAGQSDPYNDARERLQRQVWPS